MLFSYQVRAHKFIKRAVLGEKPTRLRSHECFIRGFFISFKTKNKTKIEREVIFMMKALWSYVTYIFKQIKQFNVRFQMKYVYFNIHKYHILSGSYS